MSLLAANPHDVATRLNLPPPVVALLASRPSARDAVVAVLAAGHANDALRLLAGLLPRRYAVAWLCEQVAKENLDEDDQIGLRIAQNWVWESNETHRMAAYQHVQTDRLRSLGGWMAAAVAASLPERAEPPPPPDQVMSFGAAAVAVAVAILVARRPASAATRREELVHSGIDLLEAF